MTVIKKYNIFFDKEKNSRTCFMTMKFLIQIFLNMKYIFYQFIKKMKNFMYIIKIIFMKIGIKLEIMN